MKYQGTTCDLRLAGLDDSKRILELRLNRKLNKYLSNTSSNIDDQKKWLMAYKEREKLNIEFYFMINTKIGLSIGTIRIYNIDYNLKRFTIGSWIVDENDDPRIAIESILAAEKFAFTKLGLKENHFDVRKNNKLVVEFHKKRGAKIINEDEVNYYFIYHKADFEKYVASIQHFITLGQFIE